MSFLIRGGYNSLTRTVRNVYLKKTNCWDNGKITTQNNLYLGSISSEVNNMLDITKCEKMYYLTLNSNVIYEDKQPIDYKINLYSIPEIYKHQETKIDKFILVFDIPYDKI